MKKTVSMLLVVVIMLALFGGGGTISVSAAVPENAEITQVLIPMNTDGVRSTSVAGGFRDNAMIALDTPTDESGNSYLKVTQAATVTADHRISQRVDLAKTAFFKNTDQAFQIVLKSKLRADTTTYAADEDKWIYLTLSPGIPNLTGANTLKFVGVRKAEDGSQQVKVGNTVLPTAFPAGEFIDFEITLNVPEYQTGGDVVSAVFQVNGTEYTDNADIPFSDTRSHLVTILTGESARISYIANKSTEIGWSVDDSGMDANYAYNYYKSIDYSVDGSFDRTDLRKHSSAVLATDGAAQVVSLPLNSGSGSYYNYFTLNDTSLKSFQKPLVFETRLKFPDNVKGQTRLNMRGGGNAADANGTIAFMTFNRGTLVLRDIANPADDRPNAVKMGEYLPDVWYNARVILNFETEKMYARVYTDDYKYDVSAVTDIPIEKIYKYEATSWENGKSFGIVVAGSAGEGGTTYQSGMKAYTLNTPNEGFTCGNVTVPQDAEGVVTITASEVVDTTSVLPTLSRNGVAEEYTVAASGDGKVVTLLPKNGGTWTPGEYSLTFDAPFKDIFGRAYTMPEESKTYTFTIFEDIAVNSAYSKTETEVRVTGNIQVHYDFANLEKMDVIFAAYRQDNELAAAKKATAVFENQNARFDIALAECETAETVRLFLWSESMQPYVTENPVFVKDIITDAGEGEIE